MRSFLTQILGGASKLANDAIESLKSIDFNEVNKSIASATATAQTKLFDLVAQVKNLNEKHIVEIPFDNTNSRFSFRISGNLLDITTTSNDGAMTNTTQIAIPEGVDVMDVHQSYDAKRKMIIFKFGMLPLAQEA